MKSIKIKAIQSLIKKSNLKGFDFTVWEYDDCLELVHIKVPSVLRGQGIGSIMMTELCKYADERRLPLRLEVIKTSAKLKSFYNNFGFSEGKINERDLLEMIRYK